MSKLASFQDLNVPFTEHTYAKLIGKINQKNSLQGTAATLTADVWVADFSGILGDAYAVLGTVPGAGESMVIDLQKNGSSCLTATKTIDNTSTNTDQIPLALDLTKCSFVPGDVFAVVRTYTAGGTPAPMKDTQVCIEPSLKNYIP